MSILPWSPKNRNRSNIWNINCFGFPVTGVKFSSDRGMSCMHLSFRSQWKKQLPSGIEVKTVNTQLPKQKYVFCWGLRHCLFNEWTPKIILSAPPSIPYKKRELQSAVSWKLWRISQAPGSHYFYHMVLHIIFSPVFLNMGRYPFYLPQLCITSWCVAPSKWFDLIDQVTLINVTLTQW